ncbi:MAG: diguanylate cyclase [Spirochaetales bacterium]|nr:diguanylate cyclase [Spirochaetales bacterium]
MNRSEKEFEELLSAVSELEKQNRHYKAALDKSWSVIETILESSNILFTCFSERDGTFYWNRGCEKHLLYKKEELEALIKSSEEWAGFLKRRFISAENNGDKNTSKESKDILKAAKNLVFDGTFHEYTVEVKDGTLRTQMWAFYKVKKDRYAAEGYDITDKKNKSLDLEKTILEFETLFNNTSIGIAELKEGRTIKKVNKRACEYFGYGEEELTGKSVEIIHLSNKKYEEFGKKYYSTLADGRVIETEYQLKAKDGRILWCSLYGKAVNPPHLDDGVIWVIADITEKKQMQEELHLLATTDSLTGVCNHRSFYDKAKDVFNRTSRYGKQFSVLMIDIDNFKQINDTCGHDTGDNLLKKMCENCKTLIREIDTLGRVGGEEFSVILEEVTKREAMVVAERIRKRLENLLIDCGAGHLKFSVSIGVSGYTSDDTSFSDVIKRADNALYEAKRNGRNRVVFN